MIYNTRSLLKPIKVPNLSHKSLTDIKNELELEGIRYIVYKSNKFIQIPEPGKFLTADDTLKIFFVE